MTTTISGTNGIDKVAAGAIEKADLPAGTVLQVVQSNTPTNRIQTTSTSYIDTGLSASIIPTSATSKILVIVQQTGLSRTSGSTGYLQLGLFRDSTQLLLIENQAAYNAGTSNENSIGGSGTNYLDTPNTTSSITYKTQFRTGNGSAVFVEQQAGITLMEIAA